MLNNVHFQSKMDEQFYDKCLRAHASGCVNCMRDEFALYFEQIFLCGLVKYCVFAFAFDCFYGGCDLQQWLHKT